MSRFVIHPRAVLSALAASLALATGILLPVSVHADPSMTVTSVSPGLLESGAVAVLDITGTGLSPDDTVENIGTAVTFSSVTSDGHGGLDVVADAVGDANGAQDLVVQAPGGQTATCTGCVSLTGESTLKPPQLEQETPAHGSVTLGWFDYSQTAAAGYDVTWTAPGGPTQFETVTDEAATISGLTDATPYAITISGHTSDEAGWAQTFTEEVGVPPSTPVVHGRAISSCCNRLDATATDSDTWTDPPSDDLVFSVVPARHPHATPYVFDAGTGSQIYAPGADDPRGYLVTATVANAVGVSQPSAPVLIKPLVEATSPRGVTYRYLDGVLTLSWSPPRNDGNSHLEGYLATFDLDDPVKDLQVKASGPSVSLPLAAGRDFSVSIQAATSGAGYGTATNDVSGRVGAAAVVTALSSKGRAKWRYDDKSQWHRIGGDFGKPPTPVEVSPHRLFFFAVSHGYALVRSTRLGWRRLTSVPCHDVAAGGFAEGLGLEVTCLTAHGKLLFAHTSFDYRTGVLGKIKGTPHIPAKAWAPLAASSTGGLTDSAVGWTAFRVKPFDTSGHDVEAFADPEVYGLKKLSLTRIPLACAGAVVVTGTVFPLFACKTGRHTVSWYSPPTQHRPARTGTITVPWVFSANFGLAGLDRHDRGVLVTTDRDGVVHEQDLHQKVSWDPRT